MTNRSTNSRVNVNVNVELAVKHVTPLGDKRNAERWTWPPHITLSHIVVLHVSLISSTMNSHVISASSGLCGGLAGAFAFLVSDVTMISFTFRLSLTQKCELNWIMYLLIDYSTKVKLGLFWGDLNCTKVSMDILYILNRNLHKVSQMYRYTFLNFCWIKIEKLNTEQLSRKLK